MLAAGKGQLAGWSRSAEAAFRGRYKHWVDRVREQNMNLPLFDLSRWHLERLALSDIGLFCGPDSVIKGPRI